MNNKTLFLLIILLSLLPAKQLSLDIKFNTFPVNKKEVSKNNQIRPLGSTEVEYYDGLLKQSLKTRLWAAFDPKKQTHNIYINDRIQGIEHTLMLELSENDLAQFDQVLTDYIKMNELQVDSLFEQIPMHFLYNEQWYRAANNQFVLTLQSQGTITNQLQLMIRQMKGETLAKAADGNDYLKEHVYDPSIFYLGRNTARELQEILSTANIEQLSK